MLVPGRLGRTTLLPPMRLFHRHEVPEELREPCIISGYRPQSTSPQQCLASLFRATNETMNFWTHFIPTCYFIWILSEISGRLDLLGDSYTWPFLSYMFTICMYPFMSCCAHAFSSLSVRARHICYFVDYASLSLYSFGAGVLYLGYGFPSSFLHTVYSHLYLLVCVGNAIVCTFMACSSRFVHVPVLKKSLRVGAFVLPYLWDTFPLAYRLYHCTQDTLHDNDDDPTCSISKPFYMRQFVAIFLAMLFYASNFPERLAPGKFDIVGHSHNILHVCGVVATNEQLNGALLDMQFRRAVLEFRGWKPGGAGILAAGLGVLLANALVVALFTAYVRSTVPPTAPYCTTGAMQKKRM